MKKIVAFILIGLIWACSKKTEKITETTPESTVDTVAVIPKKIEKIVIQEITPQKSILPVIPLAIKLPSISKKLVTEKLIEQKEIEELVSKPIIYGKHQFIAQYNPILNTFTEKKTKLSVSPEENITQKIDQHLVKIFYATNRKAYGEDTLKFSSTIDSCLNYGRLTFFIPLNHTPGEIREPNFWEKMFGKPQIDSSKIFITQNLKYKKAEFFESLGKSFNKPEDQIFIFIHGYNNQFYDAALRSAQIFYDIKVEGVPILFSWPSAGKVLGYFKDQRAIHQSIVHFQQFLKETIEKSPNKQINIIAHSMGNRLLVKALSTLPTDFPKNKIHKIVMAAPDVSAKDFGKVYLTPMRGDSTQITLYSSKHDLALKASNVIHLRRRLGLAGKKIFVNENIHTVDLSQIRCKDPLEHSCFAKSKNALLDIRNVIHNINGDTLRLTKFYKTQNDSIPYFYLPMQR